MDLPEEDRVTAVSETKSWTMEELRTTERSLYIRNNTALPWHLHEKIGATRIDIELSPAGQRNSISYLPKYALEAPGIPRNYAHGKVTVSPELEDEMMELEGLAKNARQGLLDLYDVKVEASPQSRAINVQERVDEAMANTQRHRGIVPQGLQSTAGKTVVEEFNNPSPIKSADGTVIDPKTGQVISQPSAPSSRQEALNASTDIKSVTITRPMYVADQEG